MAINVTLYPTAGGWSGGAGTGDYTNVDDQSRSDWAKGGTADIGGLPDFPVFTLSAFGDLPSSVVTVSSITLYADINSSTAGGVGAVHVGYLGANDYFTRNTWTSGGANGYLSGSKTTNPGTGVAFTPSEVNAITGIIDFSWAEGSTAYIDNVPYDYDDGYYYFLYSVYLVVVVVPTLSTNSTSAASSVTSTTAQLNGTVNPQGADIYAVERKFEWGLTTSYGNSTSWSGTLTGSGDTSVSDSISGLTPNTTYHFRVVSRHKDSTSDTVVNGSDQSFTTLSSEKVVFVL